MPAKRVIEVKYEPTDKQKVAHEALEEYILYGGAIGGGKTVWLVNEGIDLSLRYRDNAGYICRQKLDDFKKTTLPTLLEYLPTNAIVSHHQTDRIIRLINESVIYYGGLGDDERTKERLGGLELGWFGVDQAEEISENQFNLLCTRLRRSNVGPPHGFLTANPQPGWLRDGFIDQKLEDHRFIPALPRDNPHLPPDYEVKLRKKLPEHMVRQLLEGDWDIDAASNYLIAYRYIREAVNRELPATGDKVAGVDIAYYGADDSVFCLRHGNKVVHLEAWSHQDTQFSASKVARLIREFQPVMTFVDAWGWGAGTFDTLYNEGFAVKKVNPMESAIDKELYADRRAEYFHLLAKRFEKGEIDIPDHLELVSQLAGLKYRAKGIKLAMESKEKMRKDGRKSPDFADALMYSFIEPLPSTNDIPVRAWG